MPPGRHLIYEFILFCRCIYCDHACLCMQIIVSEAKMVFRQIIFALAFFFNVTH